MTSPYSCSALTVSTLQAAVHIAFRGYNYQFAILTSHTQMMGDDFAVKVRTDAAYPCVRSFPGAIFLPCLT